MNKGLIALIAILILGLFVSLTYLNSPDNDLSVTDSTAQYKLAQVDGQTFNSYAEFAEFIESQGQDPSDYPEDLFIMGDDGLLYVEMVPGVGGRP